MLRLHDREAEAKERIHDDGAEDAVRRVWVRYRDGGHDALFANHNNGKLKVNFDFPRSHSVVLTATQGDVRSLQDDPVVVSIEDDPKRYLHGDRHLRQPAHRELLEWEGQARNFGIGLVQADQVWQEGLTGAGVKVCVIDSGFDSTHEDFDQDNIDGESLVWDGQWDDDAVGHGKSPSAEYQSLPCTTNGMFYLRSHSYIVGTLVTGIIASSNDNQGLVGIAPGSSIHEIRGPDSGIFYASDLIDALNKCRDAGAKIINMSFGGDYPNQEEEEKMTELFHEYGILLVASAGNSGDYYYEYREYPASYADVMSVGAVNRLKQRAFFSTYNDMVDIAAPGFDVWSTLPSNFECEICQELVCSAYGSVDGTS